MHFTFKVPTIVISFVFILLKDGKFILELSHRRDGEKMSWIPVPKKTYWPPPVSTPTVSNSLRQESTTSLSG